MLFKISCSPINEHKSCETNFIFLKHHENNKNTGIPVFLLLSWCLRKLSNFHGGLHESLQLFGITRKYAEHRIASFEK